MGHASAHARSELLAAALADGLRKSRPGVRFRGVRQAPFGVLKEARMPAVVLELGYLTHPVEGRTLLDPVVHGQFGQAVLLSLVELDRQLVVDRRRQPAAPQPKPSLATAPQQPKTGASAKPVAARPVSPKLAMPRLPVPKPAVPKPSLAARAPDNTVK